MFGKCWGTRTEMQKQAQGEIEETAQSAIRELRLFAGPLLAQCRHRSAPLSGICLIFSHILSALLHLQSGCASHPCNSSSQLPLREQQHFCSLASCASVREAHATVCRLRCYYIQHWKPSLYTLRLLPSSPATQRQRRRE